MESVKSIIEIVHSLKEIFRNTREKRKISRKKTREKQIFKAHRKQRLNLTKINTRNDEKHKKTRFLSANFYTANECERRRGTKFRDRKMEIYSFVIKNAIAGGS